MAVLLVSFAGWLWLAPLLAWESSTPPSTKILDRKGRTLYQLAGPSGARTELPLERIPLGLIQATIATEDSTFYGNVGIEPRAIGRALLQTLRFGDHAGGASTITQQLARHLYFSPEERSSRSPLRKLREVALALKLAHHLEKDRILELYLNRVYYGNLAYGIEAAAQTYFGKPAVYLDLAEAAFLAGLPQSPPPYSAGNAEAQDYDRRATVLGLMAKAGYITQDQVDGSARERLALVRAPFPIRAPHFVHWVMDLVADRYGKETLERDGLTITTTLDLEAQEMAEQTLRRHLAALEDRKVGNGAIVALQPDTGEVLAMVGSVDYFEATKDGAVNMATSPRQPGSSFKPITYVAALSLGFTPATLLSDERTLFTTRRGQPYVPQNYDGAFRGTVTLREALGSSYNVPAVQVLNIIGLEEVLSLARRIGISSLTRQDLYDLSLTLGGGEVSLLELTGAYGVFATGGHLRAPDPLLTIRDATGKDLYNRQSTQGSQVISPQVAYLITSILSDDYARGPAFGLNSSLKLSRPAAAKTGTTSDWRDNWTIGYTPDLVVGVWVGNSDNSEMQNVSGITGAAPIWHDVIEELLKDKPVVDFPRPMGLLEIAICESTGIPADASCPRQKIELFMEGTEPRSPLAASGPLAAEASFVNRGRPFELPRPGQVEGPSSRGNLGPSLDGVNAGALALGGHGPGQTLQQGPITLLRPDPGTVVRMSREIPSEAQRLLVEARVDPPGLAMEVLVDDKLEAVLEGPPYRWWWLVEEGTHRIRVAAIGGPGAGSTGDEDRFARDHVDVVVLPPPRVGGP